MASALFLARQRQAARAPLRAAGIPLSVLGAVVVISQGDLRPDLRRRRRPGRALHSGLRAELGRLLLIGKAAMRRLSPLVAVSYSSAVGALALAVPGRDGGPRQEPRPRLLDRLGVHRLPGRVRDRHRASYGSTKG